MDDRKKTSLSFSASLAKLVKQKGIREDLDFSSSVEKACQEWVDERGVARKTPTPPAAAVEGPQRYRKDNQRWHDILEAVLNDPDERIGIQKNLEWAERTVVGKLKRPAGKRAVGE